MEPTAEKTSPPPVVGYRPCLAGLLAALLVHCLSPIPPVDARSTRDVESRQAEDGRIVATSGIEGVAGGGAGRGAWTDPVLAVEFVWVEGGCYEMGCGPWTSGCADDEQPAHEVCVDGFWLGKTEVTFEQYDAYCSAAGKKKPDDNGWGRGKRPVINVSRADAEGFARWLSSRSEQELRLPTEAEWEYAARSGGKRERWAGTSDPKRLGDHAWYGSNSGGQTHPVGTREPNGLGLHDMSGNVWEWCSDSYGKNYYGKGPKHNPGGPSGGGGRVIRGGSWNNYPRGVRTTVRLNSLSGGRSRNLGFRLAGNP